MRLLAAIVVLGLAAAPAQAAPKPKPLRFATYNVCKTSCGTGRFAWDKRKDALVRSIVAARPDVLALQETDNSYEWFAAQLAPHGYAMAASFEDDCTDQDCVEDSRLYYRTDRIQQLSRQVPSDPIDEPCRPYISEYGELPPEPAPPQTPPKPLRADFQSRTEYTVARKAWTDAYGPMWEPYERAHDQWEGTMYLYEEADRQYGCSRFVGRQPFRDGGGGLVSFATIGRDSLQSAAQNRGFAWAVLQDRRTGSSFIAVSMHMPNEKSGFAEKYRKNLANATVGFLRESGRTLGFSGSPVVLMGDLNSYWQRQPRGVQWIFGRNGFKDAFDAPAKKNDDVPTVNLTKTEPNPFPATPFHFDLPARLDYVLVKGGKALTYEVFVRTKGNGAFDNRYRGSDHNMVLADLRLRAARVSAEWQPAG